MGQIFQSVSGLAKKARDHPLITITLIGSLASIAGLVLVLFPYDQGNQSNPASYGFKIEEIKLSHRGPVWDYPSSDKDEIVVSVRGAAALPYDKYKDYRIVAFWRLGQGYETNWHVGRRRVGGNYELAILLPEIARVDKWEFIVGGIETKKTYSGDIGIILLIGPVEAIRQHTGEWLRDEIGWGFKEFPLVEGFLASQMKTVITQPIRN